MTNKIYRSALGKPVDMGSILTKNETVRAVGNMGVNARGDVLDKKNDAVIGRNNQVNDVYRKQIRNQIVDEPIINNITDTDVFDEEIEGLDTPLKSDENEEEVVVDNNTATEDTSNKKTGGLANAIAKARKVEQQKLKTSREKSREKTGVKKI